MGGECIVLDAGSGMLGLVACLEEDETDLSLLLSHPHIDHMLGFLSSQLFFEPRMRFALYSAPRFGLSAKEQLEKFMSIPFWPVGPKVFTAGMEYVDIAKSSFYIGSVRIDCMEGSHPGGCTVFKLSHNGHSIVYATDYEAERGRDDVLVAFAKDCDLFLCDGKSTDEEFVLSRGFGHSPWSLAAKLGARCCAGRTLIVHHSPDRTDAELDAAERQMQTLYPHCHFVKEREEFKL